jgi:hypothetical protein
MNYTIERTEEDILLRFPLGTTSKSIQNVLDYMQYVELMSKSKATQDDVDQLAKDVKKDWWDKNKSRFVGQPGFEHLGE